MKIKLVKSLSYSTLSQTIKRGEVTEVDDKMGKHLLSTGLFEEVSAEGVALSEASDEEPAKEEDMPIPFSEDDTITAEYIDGLKSAELDALAEERGIDLSGCSNKKEKADRIKGHLGVVDFTDLGLE